MGGSRDLEFLLYEVLAVDALCDLPRYREHDRGSFRQALEAAERLARDKFQPHAAEADASEPQVRDSKVWIIPQVGEALRALADGGFFAIGFDAALGGLQMPWVVVQACYAHFYRCNTGSFAYAMLTVAAANLLAAVASTELKARYLRPMLEGRYFGTMCLSEPDVGSSLGDLRTRAEPQSDGSFRLKGSKMWISGGEHELSENIIHMVLARIPGAPAGPAGISLFLVPRYLAEGAVLNDIVLVGLNHKMGYRATVNTLLTLGERGQCVGYLIGEVNQGLRHVFRMMNEARIAVGLSATMLARSAYEYSLEYARNRKQGRLPDNKDPLAPAVPIIAHADVRRLLLAQKASVEGSLALCLFCALLVDRIRTCAQSERRESQLLLDLLTPIAKSWPSEFCLEANKHAIQVLGGSGYTRDHPVERLYRDNRLNAIHEGTQGIQAVDLLQRKVLLENGAAFSVLMNRIEETVRATEGIGALHEAAEQLSHVCRRAEEVTRVLVACVLGGHRNLALANATVYLDMLGHVVIAWMWLWQAHTAARALESASLTERPFYLGKLHTCRYFYRYELPKCAPQANLLLRLDDTCLSMPTEAF